MRTIKKILTNIFSFEDLGTIRSIVAWILLHSGLGTILTYLFGNKGAIILVYHSVGGKDVFWDNVIDEKVFEKQLKYLAKNRTVVSLNDIVQKKLSGESIPKDWAAITFDDGYKDYALNAVPILRQYNYPATVFICSSTFSPNTEIFSDKLNRIISNTKKESIKCDFPGHIQSYALKTDKQKRDAILKLALALRELSSELRTKYLEYLTDHCEVQLKPKNESCYLSKTEILQFDHLTSIGSHSVSHANLASLSKDGLIAELNESKKILQEIVGDKQVINLFAYPFGKLWSYNDKVKKALQKTKYNCAVTTTSKCLNDSNDIYELPRIGAGNSMSRFKLNLHGLNI